MLFLLSLLTLVFPTLQRIKQDLNEVQFINTGEVGPNDILSYNLDDLFNSNSMDQGKEYIIKGKEARVVSSNYFSIIEFVDNCIRYNSAHESKECDMFTAICNQNELYEVCIDPVGKQLKQDPKMLAKVDGECYDSHWSVDLNIYALLCEVKGSVPESPGAIKVYLIDREKKKVTGSSMIEKSKGIVFTDKRFITSTKFTPGKQTDKDKAYTSTTQFLIFDAPYSDDGTYITRKMNLIFLIFGVKQNAEKEYVPDEINLFNFKVSSGFDELVKIVSLRDIGNNQMMIAGFYADQEKMVIKLCLVDPTLSQYGIAQMPFIKGCELVEDPDKNIPKIGIMQAYTTKNLPRMILYDHLIKVVRICELRDKKVLKCFSEQDTRMKTEQDITISMFDRCGESTCNVVYVNDKKDIFLGVDNLDISNMGNVITIRYKVASTWGRVEGKRLYTSEGRYLVGYDDSRKEDLVIAGDRLAPATDWSILAERRHGRTREFRNFTGYRVDRILSYIRKPIPLPNLEGQVGRLFKLPITRHYFQGNDISFELKTGPNLYSKLYYINDVDLTIDGKTVLANELVNYIQGYALKMIVTNDRKWRLANCYRGIGQERINSNVTVDLRCTTVMAGELEKDEVVIVSKQLTRVYIIITSHGRILSFNLNKKGSETDSRPVSIETQMKFIKATITVSGTSGFIAVIAESTDSKKSRVVKVYMINQFQFDSLALMTTIDEFERGKGQTTGGDVCPKDIKFKVQQTPTIIILNACEKKDRRLIYIDIIKDNVNNVWAVSKQLQNQYLMNPKMMSGDLLFCPDTDILFIANLLEGNLFGIGVTDQRINEDTGLSELGIKEIYQLICLGERAIGIIARRNDGKFYIITYFRGRFKRAKDRIHSHFEIPSNTLSVEGNSGNRIAYYTIKLEDKVILKFIDLAGPSIYLRTTKENMLDYGEGESVIGESNLQAINGFHSSNYQFSIKFRDFNEVAAVSNKNESFKAIGNYFTVDEICIWDGPVYNYTIIGDHVSISNRTSPAYEILDQKDAAEMKLTYVDSFEKIEGDRILVLGQKSDSSFLIILSKDNFYKAQIKLNYRCFGLSLLPNSLSSKDNRWIIMSSCVSKITQLYHPTIIEIDMKSNELLYIAPSNDIQGFFANQISFTHFTTEGIILSALLNTEKNILMMTYFNRGSDQRDGQGNYFVKYLHNETSIEKVMLFDQGLGSDNIYMLYNLIGDSSIRLKVISKSERKIDSKEMMIIDENDSSTFEDFDCIYNYVNSETKIYSAKDTIICAFATSTPYVHRVEYEQNDFTGLMVGHKSRYIVYGDHRVVKVAIQKEFIVALSQSASTGKRSLLVYRNSKKIGSKYLYAGLDFDSISQMELEDVEFELTEDNTILITSNIGGSFIKKINIQEMKISLDLESATFEDLTSKVKVIFNEGTENPRKEIPLGYFFIPEYMQDRTVIDTRNEVQLWVTLGIFMSFVFFILIWMRIKEKKMLKVIKSSGIVPNSGKNHLFEAIMNDDHFAPIPGKFMA